MAVALAVAVAVALAVAVAVAVAAAMAVAVAVAVVPGLAVAGTQGMKTESQTQSQLVEIGPQANPNRMQSESKPNPISKIESRSRSIMNPISTHRSWKPHSEPIPRQGIKSRTKSQMAQTESVPHPNAEIDPHSRTT